MIDEVLTGDGVSASTVATETLSEAIIGNHADGAVALQAKAPNGDWVTISMGMQAVAVATPDSTVEYRFQARGLGSQNVHVFFGP